MVTATTNHRSARNDISPSSPPRLPPARPAKPRGSVLGLFPNFAWKPANRRPYGPGPDQEREIHETVASPPRFPVRAWAWDPRKPSGLNSPAIALKRARTAEMPIPATHEPEKRFCRLGCLKTRLRGDGQKAHTLTGNRRLAGHGALGSWIGVRVWAGYRRFADLTALALCTASATHAHSS